MKYLLPAAALLLATPALAGDPIAGEALFTRCKACHMATAPDGTVVQKGGKVGPNLWGVIGRQIGAAEGFSSGASLVAAGADGTVWDEAMLAAYVTDPTAWLVEKTGDAAAKSKMTFKLKEGGADIAAYLATLK